MNWDIDESIAALASPAGGGARGIVRISGRNVKEVLRNWFQPENTDLWSNAKSARLHRGSLQIDDNVHCQTQVFFWPNRRSYTGQPLIELHLPGSPSLLEKVLESVYRRGVRPARPGEFTLRAFLAGKLDLLQAEAVLGVIDAQDYRELQTALGQLAGGISSQLVELRRNLLELLADLEAGLDFVDEDIEFVSRQEVIDRLEQAREFLQRLIEQSQGRMQSRVRLKVVLAGLPNAGKSSLFNELTSNQAALVSPERGTTRDFLTATVNWGDFSFDLIDTAGWEQGLDGIAEAAQQQRASQLHQADLLLWCTSSVLNQAERVHDQDLFEQASREAAASLRVWTKSDLAENGGDSQTSFKSTQYAPGELLETVSISLVSQSGVGDLRHQIRDCLASDRQSSGQWLGMTAARCREAVQMVATSIDHAMASAIERMVGDELIAVDIRQSLDHLGAILGEIYTDDILDRVFSKFCIGK